MAVPLFDGSSPQFADLIEACPIVPAATVSRALINFPEGRVVLFAMDAEQEMSEHRAPFPATLQVLEGRLRMTVGKINREMTARDWLVMPADAPHSLFAVEPTRFILTLLKRQST